MCEEKDCDCNHHKKHHGKHHMHHMMHIKGYTSIVKRADNQVVVPEVLLEVADVNVGDFLEINIRKIKKYESHHQE